MTLPDLEQLQNTLKQSLEKINKAVDELRVLGINVQKPPTLNFDFNDLKPACDKCNKEGSYDDDWIICDKCYVCYCSTCKNRYNVFALSGNDLTICFKCLFKKHNAE